MRFGAFFVKIPQSGWMPKVLTANKLLLCSMFVDFAMWVLQLIYLASSKGGASQKV